MNEFIEALLYATLAGITIPIGGFIANFENIHPRWLETELRHGIIAFGGGVLFAAIALVLVPEGIKHLPMWGISVSFISGSVVFLFADMLLAMRSGSASQLMAMLLDFIPEAMALGAMMATKSSVGLLLAFLIALQNLPEGFNAFRGLKASTNTATSKLLLSFCLMVLFGPCAAWIGFQFLQDYKALLGVIMLFSAGGILYLIFEDIAPQAKLKHAWGPPLGASLGFLLGLIGHIVTQ